MRLSDLEALGARQLHFVCVRPGCTFHQVLGLRDVAETAGTSARLADVARRARCRRCGERGAHVEPVEFGRQAAHYGP